MKLLRKDFKGYVWQLILGPLFKLAEAVLELFVPLVTAQIIDVAIPSGDMFQVLKLGGLMLGLGAMGAVFGITCQYFAARVSQAYGRSLRQRLFRHVFSLSAAQQEELGTASIITRLTNDVNQIQTGINMLIRLATRAPFLTVGSVIMALRINFQVGCVFLVAVPLIALVIYWITTRSVPMYETIQKRQDDISRLAGEGLEGVRVIRAFSRQKDEQEQFQEKGDELAELTVRVGRFSAALNPLTYVIVNLSIVFIVWTGSQYADLGILQNGEIIALVNYMNQVLLVLMAFSNLVILINRALASAHRVVDLLSIQPNMTYPEKSAPFRPEAPALDVEHVTFRYTPDAEPTVKDLSFQLRQGEMLGVIGGTGCGKSTLARLLTRRYDPEEGYIALSGVKLPQLSGQDLRSLVAFVPQNATLFNGTVAQNLRLGKKEATEEELWRALDLAQAREFVQAMPQGLDTMIVEGGKNLSGGQRQRLTIARALVVNPQILILDDASSALDYATDAALRRALRQGLKGTTLIWISQRASAIQRADQILVLTDGEQVGLGSHEDLLRTCQVYQEICQSQGLDGGGVAS